MTEQNLIKKYFSRHQAAFDSVLVGVGDDAAVVQPPDESNLVITTDTLNVDRHFFADCDAALVGHKSLAVSLSDIAAMGAVPLWATLSLSLPSIDHGWLEKFSDGLYALAEQYDVKLIGGDLVKGPLSISLQVIGSINIKQPLLRSNCQVDDLIYVTGNIGDAGIGLKIKTEKDLIIDQEDKEYFLDQLQQPVPRLDVSKQIVGIARAAIDVSDGLLIDLQRLLTMSDKGGVINIERIPISEPLGKYINDYITMTDVLKSGDDYELIFTIDPLDKNRVEQIFARQDIKITEIGKIMAGAGIQLLERGEVFDLPNNFGFDHFG